MKKLTYLACPYSHPDPAVRQARFEAVNRAAADLMMGGHIVFSPISHTHPIALTGKLELGWEFWKKFDRTFLEVSREVVVLGLDGWRESIGVQAELKIANEMRIPWRVMSPSAGKITPRVDKRADRSKINA